MKVSRCVVCLDFSSAERMPAQCLLTSKKASWSKPHLKHKRAVGVLTEQICEHPGFDRQITYSGGIFFGR